MHPHDDHGTHVIMLIPNCPGTHIYNFRPCSYWNPAECTCSGSTATCPSGSCWSWSWSSTVPIRFNERLSCLRDLPSKSSCLWSQPCLLPMVNHGQSWSTIASHGCQPPHSQATLRTQMGQSATSWGLPHISTYKRIAASLQSWSWWWSSLPYGHHYHHHQPHLIFTRSGQSSWSDASALCRSNGDDRLAVITCNISFTLMILRIVTMVLYQFVGQQTKTLRCKASLVQPTPTSGSQIRPPRWIRVVMNIV